MREGNNVIVSSQGDMNGKAERRNLVWTQGTGTSRSLGVPETNILLDALLPSVPIGTSDKVTPQMQRNAKTKLKIGSLLQIDPVLLPPDVLVRLTPPKPRIAK